MGNQLDTAMANIPAVSLRDYLGSTTLPLITAPHIHILDAIPTRKLRGALSSYAPQISESQVVALVDDTVFGSAKDGLLISEHGLHCKQKLESARSHAYERIHDLQTQDTTVLVNDLPFIELMLPDKMPLRYLISEVDRYLQITRRNAATHIQPRQIHQEESAIQAVLASHSRHAHRQGGTDARPVSGAIAGFYLVQDIPAAYDRLLRFFHGIDQDELIYAAIDLGDGNGNAIVFTCSAIYFSFREQASTCLAWNILIGNRVVEPFRHSIFIGVRLSSGHEIICARDRGDDYGYASALFSDLIEALSWGTHSQNLTPIPNAATRHVPEGLAIDAQRRALLASIQGFKNDCDDQAQNTNREDAILLKHLTFVLDRVGALVAQHLSDIGGLLVRQSPETRVALAQLVTFILGTYTYGALGPEFASEAGSTYFQVASMPLSYLDYCRQTNPTFDALSRTYTFLNSDEEIQTISVAMLVQQMNGLTQSDADEVRDAALHQALLEGRMVDDETTFIALRHAAHQIAHAWLLAIARER